MLKKMLLKCQVKIYASAIFVFVVLYFSAKSLSVHRADGYCFEKQKILSDDEYIALAVLALKKQFEYNPRYKSHWDFDENNKNCCRVYRSGNELFFNRLLAMQDVEVALNTKTSSWPIELGGDDVGRIYFDLCGNKLKREFASF